VTFSSAVVKSAPPAGGTWDALNDPPDPQACLSSTLVSTTCTGEVSNTYNPAWNTTLSTTYNYSDLANTTMTVYDIDVLSNDTIDSFSANLQCAYAGYPCGGTFSRAAISTAGLTSITVSIEPL